MAPSIILEKISFKIQHVSQGDHSGQAHPASTREDAASRCGIFGFTLSKNAMYRHDIFMYRCSFGVKAPPVAVFTRACRHCVSKRWNSFFDAKMRICACMLSLKMP